jgi:hypothetical protein
MSKKVIKIDYNRIAFSFNVDFEKKLSGSLAKGGCF